MKRSSYAMKRLLCVTLCLAVAVCAGGCSLLLRQVSGSKGVEGESINENQLSTAQQPGSVIEEVTEPDIAAAPLLEEAAETLSRDAGGLYYAPPVPATGGMTPLARYAGFPQSTNQYPVERESAFSATLNNPLSTFAADVDTASYANVRRMIRAQQPIDPNAVRVEEMINFFPYSYNAPEGKTPVAIDTQVAACPWNDTNLLLRIGLKAQEIRTENLPASNLVFLIDVSGSMRAENKLPLVQRSFALLADQLTGRDRVSIVVYAGMEAVVLEGVSGDKRARILEAIYELEAGGGTNGAAGILTAYEVAGRYAREDVNSRVILATDGDFNIGLSTENDLIDLVEKQRAQGIFLTVLGFGYGNLKDNNLQALADHGNGNAAYIDTIHQARTALVAEMGATLHTVAKDVKLQVEFNPAMVEAYRLIGYESRRLAAEDFADDTKDGGEMGAGHSVTALYEIVPAGSGTTSEIPLTYQTTVSTDSDDYAAVHVRYKEPQGDASTEMTQAVGADAFTDAPDENFRLASAVAAFGQMISGSDFAGDVDEDMVLDLLQPLLAWDTDGRIIEFSDLVRKAGGLYDVGM